MRAEHAAQLRVGLNHRADAAMCRPMRDSTLADNFICGRDSKTARFCAAGVLALVEMPPNAAVRHTADAPAWGPQVGLHPVQPQAARRRLHA